MAHRSQYSVGRPLMACAIFLCAFLQVLPVSTLTDAPFGSHSNALVWASEPYAKGTHTLSNGKVSYKTETVSSFVSGLFSPLLAASEAPASVFFEDEILKQAPPQVFVVAIGQQMREKVHDQTVLQKVMAAARSWISVPQLVQDDTPGRHMVQQLLEKYSGLITSGRSFIAGDCPSEVDASSAKRLQGGVSGAAEFIKGMKQSTESRAGSSPDLVMICLSAEDMQSGEMAAVDTLDTALRSSGERYVAIYTAEPKEPGTEDKELASQRRSLLQSNQRVPPPPGPPSDSIDELFHLQVNLMRAFLVIIFTVIGLLCGLCCLMSLDTPTRFESARAEAVNN